VRLGKRLLVLAATNLALLVGAHSSIATTLAIRKAPTVGPKPMLEYVNLVRASHGLAALHLSRSLVRAALHHSLNMGVHGYFGHENARGMNFGARIRNYFQALGFRVWMAGENLLETPRVPTAKRAVRLWMHSTPHRENLLNPNWRSVGFGSIRVHSAPGIFRHRSVTLLTADFGVRRR